LVTLNGATLELTDKPSEDEKETVMGILVVAFGVVIVSVVFGGALGFLLGFLGGGGQCCGFRDNPSRRTLTPIPLG